VWLLPSMMCIIKINILPKQSIRCSLWHHWNRWALEQNREKRFWVSAFSSVFVQSHQAVIPLISTAISLSFSLDWRPVACQHRLSIFTGLQAGFLGSSPHLLTKFLYALWNSSSNLFSSLPATSSNPSCICVVELLLDSRGYL